MRNFLWFVLPICPLLLIAGFLGCTATIPETVPTDKEQDVSLEEFLASIRDHIDHRVRWQDAMDEIESVRGSVVKWSGHLVRTWDDKIQVGDIIDWGGTATPGSDYVPPEKGYMENKAIHSFLILLDHPLPRETRIGDRVQTVSVGEVIRLIGRIVDRREIVTRTGVNLTVPVLRGYIISKESDRDLSNPVWTVESFQIE
jgi:hypothetical protein